MAPVAGTPGGVVVGDKESAGVDVGVNAAAFRASYTKLWTHSLTSNCGTVGKKSSDPPSQS